LGGKDKHLLFEIKITDKKNTKQGLNTVSIGMLHFIMKSNICYQYHTFFRFFANQVKPNQSNWFINLVGLKQITYW